MLKNYFKIAFRNLLSGGWYSALNIGGLSVVLAVSLLLFWWVKDELSFDRFHSNMDRIYQINAHFGRGADENTFTSTPGPVAIIASKQIPEVESVVRIGYFSSATFKAGGEIFKEKNLACTDHNFLDVFSGFAVLYGDKSKPFSGPSSVVITEKLARKFFGTADAVGRSFTNVENKTSFTVSAVLADAPDNSSLKYDMYFGVQVLDRENGLGDGRRNLDENWDDYAFETYIKLHPGTDPVRVGQKLTTIQKIALENKENASDYRLQALADIHLYPVEGNESGMQQVKILGLVALLLLSIGCINYVNLTTARATRRSKEVGIRKVVGAGSRQLARQLLVESLLTLSLSLVFSIILLQGLLPFYSNLTGKSGHFSLLDPQAWVVLSAALTFCFVSAGIYPALQVSRFNPIRALRGGTAGKSAAGLRKSLVVTQFALATILVAGTFVIGSQLRFIRERNPGFNREHVFTFDGKKLAPQFKGVLKGESSVLAVSTSTDTPVNVQSGTASTDWDDGKQKDRMLIMAQMGIDQDFIPNFQIKFAAGRNFDGTKADSAHFILNETAVKQAGIKDPIGKRFKWEGTEGTIIGVVKDFNITSIRQPVWPLILYSNPDWNYIVNVHTTSAQASDALAAAEKYWKKYAPEHPFEYKFLDADYNELYRAEQQTGKLFNFFAGIAILISCLGLLGLVSYTAEQRTKEIGIRKVLGATVVNITTLLSKDFMKLVFVAILIASPVAWFAMDQWLQSFAYKISISWWVFGAAGLLSVLTALLTIAFSECPGRFG